MAILFKPHEAIKIIQNQELERVKGIVQDILNTNNTPEEKLEVLEKEHGDAFPEITDLELRKEVLEVIDNAIKHLRKAISSKKRREKRK